MYTVLKLILLCNRFEHSIIQSSKERDFHLLFFGNLLSLCRNGKYTVHNRK